MRTNLINILVILFPVLCYAQVSTEIDFIWKSAESGFVKFRNAVMLVPVKFEGDSTTYFFQLDTGAVHSSLYSKRLEGTNFREGKMTTSIGEIMFIENHSIGITDEHNAPVGTLGADFLGDRIVQINFRSQKILIDAPYDLNTYSTKPITLLDGRPVIAININGTRQNLLYDTGSSLFGIWTSKRNWNKLREKDSAMFSFPISSWGKVNEGFFSSIDKKILLALEGLGDTEELKVWYVANRKFKRFFRKNDLYGILGNQSFLEYEILLDFRKKSVWSENLA